VKNIILAIMYTLALTKTEVLSLSPAEVWDFDELSDDEQHALLEFIAANAPDPHFTFWRMDSICKQQSYLKAEGFAGLDTGIVSNIRINAGWVTDEQWDDLRDQGLSVGEIRARHLASPFYDDASKEAHTMLIVGLKESGQFLAFDPSTGTFSTTPTYTW
jgi:hypothetical protein